MLQPSMHFKIFSEKFLHSCYNINRASKSVKTHQVAGFAFLIEVYQRDLFERKIYV